MPDRTTELVREMQKMQNKSLVKIEDIFTHAIKIFDDRNSKYGDAFEETGLLGTSAVLLGDIARLRNMIFKNPSHGREHKLDIEDKLFDIINQAAICLIVLNDNNYEGK